MCADGEVMREAGCIAVTAHPGSDPDILAIECKKVSGFVPVEDVWRGLDNLRADDPLYLRKEAVGPIPIY